MCKLTRLVLDNKWEKEKWEKAWDEKETESEVPSVADLQENKKRKDTGGGGVSKKRKVENVEGVVWGETVENET